MQTRKLTIQIYPFVIALIGGFSLISAIKLYIVLLLIFYLVGIVLKFIEETKPKPKSDYVVIEAPVIHFSSVNKNGRMYLQSGVLTTISDIEYFLKSRNYKKFDIKESTGVVKILIKQFFGDVNIDLLQKEIDYVKPIGVYVECRKYTFFEWLINIYN